MENFQIFNVSGKSKEVAFSTVEGTINVDASKSYKKAGSPEVGTEAFDEFVTHFSETHKKDMKNPGDAFSITLEKAVKNTKSRPYKINNNIITGRVLFETEVHFLNQETGELLDVIIGTKQDSKAHAKKLTTQKEVKIEVKRIKVPVKDEHKVWFTCDYIPTKTSKDGKYIVVVLK